MKKSIFLIFSLNFFLRAFAVEEQGDHFNVKFSEDFSVKNFINPFNARPNPRESQEKRDAISRAIKEWEMTRNAAYEAWQKFEERRELDEQARREGEKAKTAPKSPWVKAVEGGRTVVPPSKIIQRPFGNRWVKPVSFSKTLIKPDKIDQKKTQEESDIQQSLTETKQPLRNEWAQIAAKKKTMEPADDLLSMKKKAAESRVVDELLMRKLAINAISTYRRWVKNGKKGICFRCGKNCLEDSIVKGINEAYSELYKKAFSIVQENKRRFGLSASEVKEIQSFLYFDGGCLNCVLDKF